MRAGNFTHIVWGNLLERKGRTLSAILVIAFTVAVVLAVAALCNGFLRGVVRKAAEVFPPSVLMVKPKTLNVAMLSFNAAFIDKQVIEKVRGLPGVASASAQLSMKMPLSMEVEIYGQHAETDGVVVGVDPETVESEVDPHFTFEYDEQSTEPVPAVMPKFLLDMYNLAYADSVGLPKINENFLLGKDFLLHIGTTIFMGGGSQNKTADVRCKVVGLSSKPSLVAGIYIPLRHAEELNKWYTGKDTENYTALHVTVKDLDRLDEVTSAIQQMNLQVEGNKETYETIRFTTRAAGVVIALFAAVIVIIAIVSIVNMFGLIMLQRSGEAALMQAVGGTRRLISGLYAAETFVLGLAGGVIGVAITLPVLRYLDHRVLSSLPRLPFLPGSLFAASGWLVAACIAGAAAFSVLAVLPTTVKTVKRSRIAEEAA
ncbi:MAG: ABC transporter permease [Candidatus Sumerlaeaceae bacterium]